MKTFEDRVKELLLKYTNVEEPNETESDNEKTLKLIKCTGIQTESRYDLRVLNLELLNGRPGKGDRPPKEICSVRKV